MAQNDGLLDGPGYNTTESSTMASCFRLLFSCLQYLFAWFVLLLITIDHFRILTAGLDLV